MPAALFPSGGRPQQRIDHLTIWALLAIGGLLMVGLLSRVSAIAAAVLLLSFYLAMPPWPGYEDLIETAGPGAQLHRQQEPDRGHRTFGDCLHAHRAMVRFGPPVLAASSPANAEPPTRPRRPSRSNKGSAMQLTPEQIQIGSENFNRVSNGLNDSNVSRRDFIKAAAAGTVGLGAAYFGYKKLEGDAVRVGFIGTGDEGNILLTQHPPEYMNIVAIADIRPSNRLRAFVGDGNDDRMGLIRKLGETRRQQDQDATTITGNCWPTRTSRPS